MKLKIIEGGYGETFEQEYTSLESENLLALAFEYTHAYKMELMNKLGSELSDYKREILKRKISTIDKILLNYGDLTKFLMLSANAL